MRFDQKENEFLNKAILRRLESIRDICKRERKIGKTAESENYLIGFARHLKNIPNGSSTKSRAEIIYLKREFLEFLSERTDEYLIACIGNFNPYGTHEGSIWTAVVPNEHGDWVSQRNDIFETFIPIVDSPNNSFFVLNSMGISTNRDAWVYNSSVAKVESTMQKMVSFYNEQVKEYLAKKRIQPNLASKHFINTDPTKISWSSSLVPQLEKGGFAQFEPDKIFVGIYRPFFKQRLYFGEKMIHRRSKFKEIFPNSQVKNLVICINSDLRRGGSVLISNTLPDLHFNGDTQCFPLYYYEENQKQNKSLFDEGGDSEYVRRDGVSDFILERARASYGKTVTKEDIFYYVYGFLHSPEYRILFANDLKKMLPRLPLVEDVRDFWKFSKAGRALAELHINYETVPAYDGVTVTGADSGFYTVEKMRFPKKDQKDTILFNSKITITNIPAKAYEYVVNGKSAIEWIMERYAVTTHKESGIKNDPNDWATEVGNPRYILDLLLSIINVSVQTVDIVESLPKVTFEG